MKPSRIGFGLALAVGLWAAAASPALALGKPASGSNCDSSWVNNSGAMECFTKGEEESRAGAAHPHYVACLNGDIFCCQDNDKGQNCVAVMSIHPVTSNDWMKAVLAAQRAQAVKMSTKQPTAPRSPVTNTSSQVHQP